MQYLREISKIAEWGLRADHLRVAAYLNQLIEKLLGDGEEKAALRLQELRDGASTSVSTSAIASQSRLPVDGESRLALADEETPDYKDWPIVLDDATKVRVDEFVEYVGKVDELEAHGLRMTPSLITYGPPGTGKTQLARYIAGRLQMPLIVARADTLISSYLGSTSKNLRTLFDHIAHRHCILFLDELDAFAKLRDDQQELGELKRVVVSLLQNLDKLDTHTVLLAATNHEHLLDPAIWRRFTFKVPLNPPATPERHRLLDLFLGEHKDGLDLDLLADLTAGLSGSDIKTACYDSLRDAIVRRGGKVDQDRLIWSLICNRLGSDVSRGDPEPKTLLEIKALAPQFFTGAKLGELFGISASTISRKLQKAGKQ
jgi:SpoVK/Ycf46/Vps4 family AAA+-type ATPase